MTTHGEMKNPIKDEFLIAMKDTTWNNDKMIKQHQQSFHASTLVFEDNHYLT